MLKLLWLICTLTLDTWLLVFNAQPNRYGYLKTKH